MIRPIQPPAGDFRLELSSQTASALDSLPARIVILAKGGTIIWVNSAWRQFAAGLEAPSNAGVGMDYLSVCDRFAALTLPRADSVSLGIGELFDGYRCLLECEYRNRAGHSSVIRARTCFWPGEQRLILFHERVSAPPRTQHQAGRRSATDSGQGENAKDGRLTLSPSGVVLSCNAAAERIFGFGSGQLRGVLFHHLLAGEAKLEAVWQGLEGADGCRLQGANRSQGAFPMTIRAAERMAGQIHSVRAISVRRIPELSSTATEELPIDRLIEKLHRERDQRKQKEQYISLMSHELRTPLTSIQLSHDMLALYSDRATPEDRRQYLDNIRQQVEVLNDIVSDVMNLSRSYQARFDFSPREHDLVAFCRGVVESFAVTHKRTHQLAFYPAETELSASFDWHLLRRALSNLLGNAIKYSPDGGDVTLRLWRDGERARMTIADEGIGIPPQDMDTLFLAFQRAANVGALPGNGLGLAITKQALDAHGGEIHISSELDCGTTVEVALPLAPAPCHCPPRHELESDANRLLAPL